MIDEDQAGFVTNLTVELVDQAKADEGNLAYHNSETVKNSWETTQELVERTVTHWGLTYKPCRYYIGESDLNVTAPTMEGTDGKSLGIAFYLTSVAAQLGLSLQKGIAVTGCVEKTGDFRYPGALEQKVLGRFGARVNPEISRIVIGPPPRGSADLGAEPQTEYNRILEEYNQSGPNRSSLILGHASSVWKPAIVQKVFDVPSWFIFLLRNKRVWHEPPSETPRNPLQKAINNMQTHYAKNYWLDLGAYLSNDPKAIDIFGGLIKQLAREYASGQDTARPGDLLNTIRENMSLEQLLQLIDIKGLTRQLFDISPRMSTADYGVASLLYLQQDTRDRETLRQKVYEAAKTIQDKNATEEERKSAIDSLMLCKEPMIPVIIDFAANSVFTAPIDRFDPNYLPKLRNQIINAPRQLIDKLFSALGTILWDSSAPPLSSYLKDLFTNYCLSPGREKRALLTAYPVIKFPGRENQDYIARLLKGKKPNQWDPVKRVLLSSTFAVFEVAEE